jgi:polyhydroxyalkanoate synthesis regulator phasin
MKSRKAIAYIVLALVVGIGMIGLRAAWAQDPNPAPKTTGVPTKTKTITIPDGEAIRKSVEKQLAQAGFPFGNSMESQIRKAAEKLRDAKTDEAKAQAREELADLLGKYFDEDMARREKDVTKLEERLAKLREQLQRRREKKQDIIDLQIQVALNEAEGLGFVSRPRGFPFGGELHIPEVTVNVPPILPMPPMPPQPGDATDSATE